MTLTATLKDVAKYCNVSPSTVSRVLANNPKISEETREKVYSAIEKLNYYPNVIARSLANKSTKILGLILPRAAEDLFKNLFFIQIMSGISIYAQKKGYYIMYAFSKDEKEELNYVENYVNSKLVEGIILLISRHNDKCVDYLSNLKYPFAVVGRPESAENILWVDNDNFQAMYNVVNTIIQRGHRKIAFIGGSKEMNMSRDRLDGYKKALQTHGISIDNDMICEEEEFTEACGYEALNKIIRLKTPTAVVATDDLLAFGALRAINDKGLKIAAAGFNNIPLAAYQRPSLSSVDINAEKLGYHAAKLLIDRFEDSNLLINHYIVEAQLIERDSTK
jgi:DNA-binding LacI/PurR family transcriptional regulator